MVQNTNSSPPDNDAITSQLERILNSPGFDANLRQKAILTYIVNQTLAGKAREITDATLAIEVFGRRSDYDPKIDPIVRIQTDVLRRALARYYETAGKNDPIRIDIPRGTCVPVFQKQKPKES
jgi:hypothetical protein